MQIWDAVGQASVYAWGSIKVSTLVFRDIIRMEGSSWLRDGLVLYFTKRKGLEHPPRRRIGTKPILIIEVNEEGKMFNTKSSP